MMVAMRRLSFDIMDIDGHLEIGNVDVVHFNGSCHDGLSHDETFCTDDLNPPFDYNIPTKVSDESAVIRVNEKCQTEHELVHDRVNEHIHTRLEIVAVMVYEHIDNDDLVETAYDVEFSENEGNKDDEDVIVYEENEINEVDMEKGIQINHCQLEFLREFMRVWVLKEGFKACKRNLLGLDEAIMKGLFPEQVVSAVGLDENNGIYTMLHMHGLKHRAITLGVGSYSA
nr:hypothetical protein [Tanacetum cinerariifolium]